MILTVLVLNRPRAILRIWFVFGFRMHLVCGDVDENLGMCFQDVLCGNGFVFGICAKVCVMKGSDVNSGCMTSDVIC